MKKKIFTLLFFCLVCFTASSQGEANNWYFGFGAGLVFDNINGTVTPTSDAQNTINTLEGCSSISDPNGNLKFYTDGRDVWDADHNLMSNANYFGGSGLLGDPSITSSGVIIPKPGDLDKYYIFTIPTKDPLILMETQLLMDLMTLVTQSQEEMTVLTMDSTIP